MADLDNIAQLERLRIHLHRLGAPFCDHRNILLAYSASAWPRLLFGSSDILVAG
jgi:hypothetical protein